MDMVTSKFSLRIVTLLLLCVPFALALYFVFSGIPKQVDPSNRIERVDELTTVNDPVVTQSLDDPSAFLQTQQVTPAHSQSDSVMETTFPAGLIPVLQQSEELFDVPTRLTLLEAKDRLSEVEFETIYAYLGQRENRSGLEDGHWLWLKNDLMTFMRERDPQRSRYFEQLEGLFMNNRDAVIRDYALQHLTVLALGGEFEEQVRDVLKQGISVKEKTIAGTSLLGYSRLIDDDQEDLEWIRTSAQDVVKADGYDAASRATAMQVLAKIDGNAANSIAHKKAVETNTPSMERISAVAVLGCSKNSYHTLKALTSDSDARVRRAARSALSKLNSFE